MTKRCAVLFLALLMLTNPAAAANDRAESTTVLELPLTDYPYNWTDEYRAPSMMQALELSKGFYQSVHHELDKAFAQRPAWRYVSMSVFDVLAIWLPPGSAWVHEEWHRAVMGRRGIDSYNDVYDFKIFAESIAVSEVRDEDLIRLKREYPADMIRLHSAGNEAQLELAFALDKDIFFRDSRHWNPIVRWENYAGPISYLSICASEEADTTTQEFLARENADVSERDFTGLDCNAWVYDLFRPDEPYEDRGPHPSGVGIDRYIQYSDLSGEEQDYLRLQYYLSYLNLMNPMLLDFRRFGGTNPWSKRAFSWNISLRHHLTSFGFTVDANLFWREAGNNLLFTVHNYFNREHYFPGIDMELLDYPFSLGGRFAPVSLRLGLWSQPAEHSFTSSRGRAGGHASLRMALPLSRSVLPYWEVQGKTAGWQAGNVYLDSALETRLGIRIHLR